MDRREFIRILQEALEGQIPSSGIRENTRYYEDYILEQVRGGKSERQVLEELGDPRLIARSIIEAGGLDASKHYGQNGEEIFEDSPYGRADYDERHNSSIRYVDLSKWYWKLAMVAAVGLILYLVFSLFAGLLRILWPLLFVIFFVSIFRSRRR